MKIMPPRFAVLVILILIILPSAEALDVRLSGAEDPLLTESGIRRRLYRVPPEMAAGEAGLSGILLKELFPPLFDAWALSLVDGQGRRHWLNGSLAELTAESLLLDRAEGWELWVPEVGRFSQVEAITLTGEALLSRELAVWISWEGTDLLKRELERYAAYFGVTLEVTALPNPESKLISVLRGGGELPDLVMLAASSLERLVEGGALQPLPRMGRKHLSPDGIRAFTLKGKPWALPFYCDSQLVIYNPELVDLSRHRPLTLTDLEREAEALVGRVPVPLAWNAFSVSWLLPFRNSFGGTDLIDHRGRITVHDGPTRQALEYLCQLQDREYFRPMERDAMFSFFTGGRTAIILSASYAIPYLEELGVPFAVAAFPVNGETGLPAAPLLDFKGFAIPKRSRHSRLARHLLSWLTGPGVQQRFPVALTKLPAHAPVAALVRDWNPRYEVLTAAAEAGQIVPPQRAYGVYKNLMWKLIRFALTGQMTPEEVLERGEALLEEALRTPDRF